MFSHSQQKMFYARVRYSVAEICRTNYQRINFLTELNPNLYTLSQVSRKSEFSIQYKLFLKIFYF